MTYEESQELIKCKKHIKTKVQLQSYTLDSTYLRKSIDLESLDYPDISFKLDINNSKKYSFKITLHILKNDDKIGLLRVDFYGQHTNPTEITATVPDILKTYKGKWFDFTDHHIHFQVDGYKNLAWAMPLIDYKDFKCKTINNTQDIYNIIIEFFRFINVTTPVTQPIKGILL